MNQTNYNYISHTHCWNNPKNPCGISLEKHTQCCLCDMKYNNRIREEIKLFITDSDNYSVMYENIRGGLITEKLEDFIDELLKSQREEYKESIKEERKRITGIIRQVGALENDEEVEKLIDIINNC